MLTKVLEHSERKSIVKAFCPKVFVDDVIGRHDIRRSVSFNWFNCHEKDYLGAPTFDPVS